MYCTVSMRHPTAPPSHDAQSAPAAHGSARLADEHRLPPSSMWKQKVFHHFGQITFKIKRAVPQLNLCGSLYPTRIIAPGSRAERFIPEISQHPGRLVSHTSKHSRRKISTGSSFLHMLPVIGLAKSLPMEVPNCLEYCEAVTGFKPGGFACDMFRRSL